MSKFRLVEFAVLFIISTAILICFSAWSNDDGLDPEYAVSIFEQEVVTRQFQFNTFDRLYFLNDNDPLTNFSKKTKILGAIPTLRIVNSDAYRVEITANADVFNALKIATNDDLNDNRSSLIVTFSDACYVPVHTDDSSYDYDTGLYVDFDKFEVTVYAPISSLLVDSTVVLDYQAPKCEKMYASFSYEGTDANIYDIDAENFILYCSGTSDITLSGKVNGRSAISVWHQTKIDANSLETGTKDFYISSSVLSGFSCIKHNGICNIGLFTSIFPLIIAAILYLPPVIWLVCFIYCFRIIYPARKGE